MTVIWRSSPMRSSMTVPKMMLASGSAISLMISAASSTSKRPRLGPPVTLKRTPWAPLMLISSSGLEMASRAALAARSGPLARPMPMRAEPAERMTARTSAKSRLMRPGTVMRSLMPCTPWRRTSSTTRKASTMDVSAVTTSLRRSLGMVMSVSTLSRSSSADFSALRRRRAPSQRERLGHDADGQGAHVARDLGDDGCGPGAGPTTHAGGDEDEVGVTQRRRRSSRSPPPRRAGRCWGRRRRRGRA